MKDKYDGIEEAQRNNYPKSKWLKKYYHIQVVSAGSAEEAREKVNKGFTDVTDSLCGVVIPGKKLHREIAKRTVVPVKRRTAK